MKKIHELGNVLSSFFSSKPATALLSVLFALVIWFTISINVYPSTPVRFYQLPLQIDLTGTAAQASGLSVVSCDVETVNVELVGNRSQVGRLTEEDLVVYAELENINSAGEYDLNLNVQANNGITFQVDKIVPATAKVKLDKIETRTFNVTADLPNIKVASGHILNSDEVVCEPATIDITGPAAQLDAIGKVSAYYDRSMELDSSYQGYTNQVKLYTENGSLVDSEGLDIPTTNFQISVPVLTQKTLPLTYNLIGCPSNFDQDWLRERLSLSEETITLASRTGANFANEDWAVEDVVRLSDIDLDYSAKLKISAEEDLINLSGIQEVTLTLDNTGLAKKNFTVSSDNISVINAPVNYDFSLVTRQLEITVIGSEEQLVSLTADDIIITVDLRSYNADQDSASFIWNSSISFYQKDRLWATGSYTVTLERQEQETADTTEQE